MTNDTDRELESWLSSYFSLTDTQNYAAADRVLRSLATQSLPPQKTSFLTRWPAVLLNWDFTPAWPRVAAFAVCAGLGFAVGFVGLDTRVDEAAAITVASSDLSALGTDAEPLTGLRP